MYSTGYNGTVRTREQLLVWSHWQNLDPEMQRRTLALLDASIRAGRPLGIGSIFRRYDQQLAGFLSRHYVDPNGKISWNGQRWTLRPGMAPMAPPGRSYHEATTPAGKALAIDFTGDLKFLAEHQAAYGLNEFTAENGEPWHGQPIGIPNSRRYYVAATHDPLKEWSLPAPPQQAPTRIPAPIPTLVQGGPTNDVAQVRHLQHLCNWFAWRDTMNRSLVVDGDFGSRTTQAVMSMQRALQHPDVKADGQYGPVTTWHLQIFLDHMVTLAARAA